MEILRNRWVILSILAFTWGSSFILIKQSLQVFTPYQIGSIRVILSGLIFMRIGFAALKKTDRRTFLWLSVAGALGNFVPMYLFPLAQTKVSSSMAGILDSLVPVFVLLLGYWFFKLRSSSLQWAGVVVGFAGAGTLMYFSGSAEGGSDPVYASLIVMATACYGGSALIVSRKLAHVPSLRLSAGVFTLWMFPAIGILFFTGFSRDGASGYNLLAGAAYLGILSVVGTALAILLYFRLIQATSAVFASMVTYLLPVVAVFWGVLSGEEFNMWFVLGGLLILIGIYLVQEKKHSENKDSSAKKYKKAGRKSVGGL